MADLKSSIEEELQQAREAAAAVGHGGAAIACDTAHGGTSTRSANVMTAPIMG